MVLLRCWRISATDAAKVLPGFIGMSYKPIHWSRTSFTEDTATQLWGTSPKLRTDTQPHRLSSDEKSLVPLAAWSWLLRNTSYRHVPWFARSKHQRRDSFKPPSQPTMICIGLQIMDLTISPSWVNNKLYCARCLRRHTPYSNGSPAFQECTPLTSDIWTIVRRRRGSRLRRRREIHTE